MIKVINNPMRLQQLKERKKLILKGIEGLDTKIKIIDKDIAVVEKVLGIVHEKPAEKIVKPKAKKKVRRLKTVKKESK